MNLPKLPKLCPTVMSGKANYLVIMYLFTKMSQRTGFKITIAMRIFNLAFTLHFQRMCLKIPSQNDGLLLRPGITFSLLTYSRCFSNLKIYFLLQALTITYSIYRDPDKSLARPGRKQARKKVRKARDFNIQTRAVIKFFFFFFCKARRRRKFTPFWQKL